MMHCRVGRAGPSRQQRSDFEIFRRNGKQLGFAAYSPESAQGMHLPGKKSRPDDIVARRATVVNPRRHRVLLRVACGPRFVPGTVPDPRRRAARLAPIPALASGRRQPAGWTDRTGIAQRVEPWSASLIWLTLEGTKMNGSGLAHLPGLASLELLDLDSTNVTDAGLAHLTGPASLLALYLEGTQITDAGLARVAEFTGLEELSLSKTRVTDAGLVHLAGLSNLHTLWLSHTQVSDAGLIQLKTLPRLQVLLLDGTQVTDAGLTHLNGLTRLEELSVDGTVVSDAGIKELQRALPSLTLNR
jgi:hypothetical protein